MTDTQIAPPRAEANDIQRRKIQALLCIACALDDAGIPAAGVIGGAA